jgi:hypothetical protein
MTWSLQNWVHEAKERRHNYEKHGLGNQPYAWVLNKGHDIPQGAIVGGQQNGEPMYICRAFFEVSMFQYMLIELSDSHKRFSREVFVRTLGITDKKDRANCVQISARLVDHSRRVVA